MADLGFEKEGEGGLFCTTSLIALISPTKLKWFKMVQSAIGGQAAHADIQILFL